MEFSEYAKIEDSIRIEKKVSRARQYKSISHYHNACEIHYFIEGDLTFFVHDQSYKVKSGDILFIDTYEVHNPVYKLNDYDKILIMYRPSFTESLPCFKVPDVFSILNKKYDGNRLISAPPALQKRIERILSDMLEANVGESQYKLTYLHLYLSLFLVVLAEYLDSGDAAIDQASLLNQKVKKIIAFINANLDRQLSLEAISKHFNINKYYLSRFFKQHTGLSVIDYVNRKKILAAEKLIAQNKFKITDISSMTGFNNLTHFERTFKQFTGTSPRNYKLNTRQEISG